MRSHGGGIDADFRSGPACPGCGGAIGGRFDTLAGLAARGIRLNPNATDTDFDGLPDGQELVVKSVKTPKRYPTGNRVWIATDDVDLGLAAPAWALSRVDAMVGFTHEDMGEVIANLRRSSSGAVDRCGMGDGDRGTDARRRRAVQVPDHPQ